MTRGNVEISSAPRILVVDDDADQRELVCDVLRLHFSDQAAAIVSVGTARECLEQNLAQFDIVLLDYYLPDMPGLDVLQAIIRRCDVPVLFVTGENVPATAAQAIQLGAQDYIIKMGNYLLTLPVMVEKNLRLHAIQRENARLHEELEARMRELRTIAATDHLTGLSNRRTFSELLDRCYSEAVRYGFDLSCAMCDLDHYKQLNDTLGHQAGDRILVAAADVIRSNLRTSDTAARYGGDEFVLLLPHTSIEMAVHVANRIRQQLAEATKAHTGDAPGVTMSIGVSSLLADGAGSGEVLIAQADRALYMAKQNGKNRIATCHEIPLSAA